MRSGNKTANISIKTVYTPFNGYMIHLKLAKITTALDSTAIAYGDLMVGNIACL